MAPPRKRRKQEESIRLISQWLREEAGLGPEIEILDFVVPRNGFSNETIVVDVRSSGEAGTQELGLVFRIGSVDHRLFKDYDVLRQAEVMAAIPAASELPVPRVRWREPGSALFGAPFFVMDRVTGIAPPDLPSYHEVGWVTDLPEDERRTLALNALTAMATIHRMPWQPHLAFLAGEAAPSLAQFLRDVEQSYEWARAGRDYPVQQAALAYLHEHQATDLPVSVLWGDARIGNLMFAPDHSVSAVLDWEMAALGPAEIDLGWWLMMERRWTEGRGIKALAGTPDRTEVIGIYEDLLGRRVGDTTYYEILAALRLSLVMIRTNDKLAEYGILPAGHSVGHGNPVTQQLARLLDVPVPDLSPDFATSIAALSGQLNFDDEA